MDVIGFSRGAALALHFCNRLARGVVCAGETVIPRVRFLGLWDTVPSFGLPGVLFDFFNDVNAGWELDLPANVERCFHAMALDEDRQAFQVRRPKAAEPDKTLLQEVWFRGVHGDVGGGNGKTGLSSIALRRMLQAGVQAGLPVDTAQAEALTMLFNPKEAPGLNPRLGRKELREPLPCDVFDDTVATPLQVGEERTVTVHSEFKFNTTAVLLRPREEYVFRFDPGHVWLDASIISTAKGWSEEKLWLHKLWRKALESKPAAVFRRVKDANWFELVACVERNLGTAVPVGGGQHSSEACPWKPAMSGRLSLFANDADSKYGNNSGCIDVSVRRVR